MNDRDLQAILDFVDRFSREKGFPPSYAEIAEACGLGSVGHVQYRVNRLIAAGRLERTPGLARSLRVVAPPMPQRRRPYGLWPRIRRWLGGPGVGGGKPVASRHSGKPRARR